jgi:hypothetical protein
MPSDKGGWNMPDTAIVIKRIAQDAVRVQFDPDSGQGTAVFMIDLAREVGGTAVEVDRHKVLLNAKTVAENFIGYVDREIPAARSLSARNTPPT